MKLVEYPSQLSHNNLLDEGNTPKLAGNFDTYAAFFQKVCEDGKHASADE